MLGKLIELHIPNSDGDLVSVPAGKAVVLEFWAPTCEPCKKTVPALVAREADIRAKGARLYLVGVLTESESTEEGAQTLASWGVKRPFLVDRGGAAKSAAGVRALPATVVVDKTGKLVWVAPEGATPEDVVRAIP